MKKLLSLFIIFSCAYTTVYAQCPSTVIPVVTLTADQPHLCAGMVVKFTAAVINGGDSPTYIWEKNATMIAGETNSTYTTTLSENDVYTISIISSDVCASPLRATSNTLTTLTKPSITSASTGNICSGVPQNYLITSNIPSTYYWTRVATIGITPATGSGSTNSITETLTNSTSLVTTVRYKITPTSENGCIGETFNYDVTLNPRPNITSAATGAICSGISPNYEITSSIASTYYWTRAVVTNVTPATVGSGTTSPVTEALSLAAGATLPINVTYTITPTSINGSCVGTPLNYVVTVNPLPVITGTIYICSGSTTQLTGSGIAAATDAWSSSAPNIASVNNAGLVTGIANGTSIITYKNNSGCIKTATITVNATAPPTVSLNATSNTICAGTSVTFKASAATGGIPTYSWNSSINGLLSSTTDTYTSNILENDEVITVTMTSSLDCAIPKTASSVIRMTVAPIVTPSISVSSGKAVVCQGGDVVFIAAPTNGGSAPLYEWFINQTSQGGPTSSNTFTTSTLIPTANTVSVKLTSNAVCASSATAVSAPLSITVNSGISAGIIGSDQTICYGTTADALTELTASDSVSLTYAWEQSVNPSLSAWTAVPGSSSGSGFIPQETYTSDIYFRRIVTDASTFSPCNVATSNTIHIIVLPPLATGTISSDETICVGTVPSAIIETASTTGGTGIYTYQWESSLKSGGPYADVSNETNSSYSPDALTYTMYFRRLETSGSCGSVYSNEVAKTVALTTLSTVNIDDPGATCDGDIVLIKCKATNVGPAPVYNWYVNNNMVFSNSPTSSNLIEPLKSGDEVWVELISSSSCTNVSTTTISNKVIVDLVPCTVSNSIYTTNNIPILLQQYVSNSIPNSTDYTYFWSITDGFITTNVITGPNPISAGQQNVTYSVPNQAGFTYAWTATGGTIAGGQGTNAITVDWDATGASPTARTTAAAYSVSVTETNQANQSKTTTMDLNTTTTSIATPFAQSGIQFYPNPSVDAFNIVMPQSGTLVHYSITDLSGMAVAAGTFTSTGGAEKIATNFNTGLYQVVLTYNETVTCLRLNKVQ